MSKITLITTTSAKYVYMTAFFVLLAGFFHPLVSGTSFDSVIYGTLALFLGLLGGVLVYKAITSKQHLLYMGGGLGVLTITLFVILQMTGRL